ncbi:MAG: hypothetical protein WKF89_18755, partial [Chitinophagaceae bacterium]
DQRNKAFKGVTYSYKTTVFYGKATASGTVNTASGKVKMMELDLVEVKMSQNSYACIMTYSLQYKKNGEDEFLEGTYTSFNERDSSSCGRGTVILRKVATSDFYKEPFLVEREKEKTTTPQKKITPPLANNNTGPKLSTGNSSKPIVRKPTVTKTTPDKTTTKPPLVPNSGVKKPTVAKTPPPTPAKKPSIASNKPSNRSPKPMENKSIPDIVKADSFRNEIPAIKRAMTLPRVLTTRENELIKTITVNENHVSINIYDNGTIDHDTVSVYLDKKLVVSKQMLTTSPITLSFEMDDVNVAHEIIMVAENLGDFPPNTSLMVVKAGEKQYEVRITSTEQKNAVIIFKYEKPR